METILKQALESQPILQITSDVLKAALLPLKESLSPFVQRYNATEFLNNNVAPKLEAIPIENRVEPSVKIFKRVLEGVTEVPDEPLLKEMFANLLVSDMNTATKSKVHPKFASILADMTTEEAKFLQTFKQNNSLPVLKKNIDKYFDTSEHLYHEDFYTTGLSYQEIEDTIVQNRANGLLHSIIHSVFLDDGLNQNNPWFVWCQKYNESRNRFEIVELTSFGINFRDVVLAPSTSNE